MEIRKILKKATAVAASASFIGATMLGAVAQDLANYPAPFVKDGTFDAFIVVGSDAKTDDVLGAVDIGQSLQFALKKVTTVSAGAAVATIDEGVKIQKSGNKFNYEDSIAFVEDVSPLTDDDLPVALASGKFVESEGNNKNTETYTQELLFNDTTTAKLVYAQDDDEAPKAGDYLFIDKGEELYNYTLEFDSPIDYTNTSSTTANDDLKTATLNIQGQTYTITDVTLSGGRINKLTLLSGEAVLWLTQNNPITKTVAGVEHTVEVLDVTENEDACQVKVDGVTVIVDEDETRTISGVQIGVTDVRAIHAQLQDVDVCQISIGASEIELENGKEVKVDDEELEGSRASMIEARSGEFDGFSVTYRASDLEDDVYLASGKEFIDPVFRSWKIVYGGLSGNYESYSLKRSGSDKADFKFVNNDGKSVTIPLFMNETNTQVGFGEGDDVDEKMIGAGTGLTSFPANCKSTGDISDCEGTLILAATANGEAHVFEIVDIDTTDNETDIRDETYGRLFEDVDFVAESITSPLSLGSFGSITLNYSRSNKEVTAVTTVNAKIETDTSGSLTFVGGSISGGFNAANITLYETDRSGNPDIPDERRGANVTMRAQPDATDEELDLFATLNTPASEAGYSVELQDDSDFDVLVTQVGTKVTVNTEDDNSIVIDMPNEEVYGNVFIAPIVAKVSTAVGGVQTYTLSKINVGSAKLDSEISDVAANNLIVVGGPCVNKVAAQVLGKTYPACGNASGIAPNTAMIKAVAQTTGKVALVVAGWEAVDTRRASRVLANYDQYDLSGSSVEVTGTSLTDIKVKKSA